MEGDVILVSKREGEWWNGSIGDRTGLFPNNYVKPKETDVRALSTCWHYIFSTLCLCGVLVKVCTDDVLCGVFFVFQTSSISGKKKPGKDSKDMLVTRTGTYFWFGILLQIWSCVCVFCVYRNRPGDQSPLLYWPRTAESRKWSAHPHPQQERLWLVAWRTAGQCFLSEGR